MQFKLTAMSIALSKAIKTGGNTYEEAGISLNVILALNCICKKKLKRRKCYHACNYFSIIKIIGEEFLLKNVFRVNQNYFSQLIY